MGIESLKCPNCGAQLTFNPKTKQLDCDYCMSHFSEDDLEVKDAKEEENISETNMDSSLEEESVMYHCPGCGAHIICDSTTVVGNCYYCHGEIILMNRVSGDILPDRIIPFSIDKEDAIKSFTNWTKKKKFIASDFTAQQQIDNITGVYFPYWFVDISYNGHLEGNGHTSKTWQVGDMQYTKKDYYHLVRQGTASFSNIFKQALDTTQMELTRGIMPYDLTKAEPFTIRYLAGFQAEKRNIETSHYNEALQNEYRKASQKLFENSIRGYRSFQPSVNTFQEEKTKWTYALMPVWLITYKDENEQLFYFAMNGQTGKINGSLPVDKLKLRKLSLIITVIFFIISLLATFTGGA